MKKLLAMLLLLSLVLSLGVTAFAEEGKTETKTWKDEKGETVTEVYDEDGRLIHREEPYYKNGKKSGTLCYDSIVWCSWSNDKYTTQAAWTLPVLKPDTELNRCLSYTLNMAYFKIADSRELGTQNIYVREDGIFRRADYLDMDELETFYDMDFKYDSPKKVDGFAIQPYRYVSSGDFSLACALTDVYYLK
ncbi:MAG: hypothetical protein K6C12_02380 [Oscillospiraceae bacterium]|nr:hypothetical protein [Oscillospiraceae bacterium]